MGALSHCARFAEEASLLASLNIEYINGDVECCIDMTLGVLFHAQNKVRYLFNF